MLPYFKSRSILTELSVFTIRGCHEVVSSVNLYRIQSIPVGLVVDKRRKYGALAPEAKKVLRS